ncbi:MAG: sigma-54 dependent transcriptional regulator [Anaerohalosphaeraceae bacterium]|nr:sigma-54 dependent transcriptional regulator [Anaerohalosphaeraceae bacterium]
MAKDKITIMVVDDEKAHADVLVEAVESLCDEAVAVYDANEAVRILQSRKIDIVITDLNLADENVNGLDVLDIAKEQSLATEVILITAYATIETCKEAIRRGAFDYLVKPIDIDQLRTMVERAVSKKRACRAKAFSSNADKSDFKFDGVKGSSRAMQSVFAVLRKVSPTNITVLIEGSSGTGKELLARAVHNNSPRKSQPFKPINCAGLTESLLESELFGHAKGSFTGATEARKGLFQVADKGTLFLDEIGDMPMPMQSKLLRVLEDGIVVPVGSNKSTVVDVRVISATNHNLAELVSENKFRQDLYFRIKGVSVTVPLLKDRVEDFGELAEYFLRQACDEIGIDKRTISDSALEILKGYSWPGNIRQLRNCVRMMVVMGDTDVLGTKDIPPEIHQIRQLPGQVDSVKNLAGVALEEIERQAIVETLAKVDGNREQAAKLLGIGERTLYRKIKDYNIG